MTDYRITSHPILHDNSLPTLTFYWNDQPFLAKPGEMIASALYANGIRIFGHHPKDDAPQGIFCANGQCAQCMVIADGLPVKACMTAVRSDMRIMPAKGLPALPEVPMQAYSSAPVLEYAVEVLIIGGGPAGLSAAKQLGEQGVQVLLIDDKSKLGGKLVLQTHRFFGSKEAVYAGTRGIDIALELEEQVRALLSVNIWISSTALGIFEDHTVGVLREGSDYVLVHPEVLLVATGAREKSLAFAGNTLPGVYGAGAFQTLVNRDLVKPCQDLFIVGCGNVGLIAGYHAIQAGIHVAGLVEAAPQCGGYKVHQDKLARSGVPIYTSHTVVEALGKDHIEKVVIAQVDEHFQPIPGTEKIFSCDTLLIAVGLDPVNEFTRKAQEVGLPVFAAGDANEIAEASAAIFSGKIVGTQIAELLGKPIETVPQEWYRIEEILKSKPGKTFAEIPFSETKGVFPVLHCTQEIPCDPCANICPRNLIYVNPEDIRSLPHFLQDDQKGCTGCLRCVAVCPGLAITLVDFRKSQEFAQVSLPYELQADNLKIGDLVEVTNTDGESLGCFPVLKVRQMPAFSGTTIVTIEVPIELATRIAGLRLIAQGKPEPFDQVGAFSENLDDEAYICRCERVKAGEIRSLIRAGMRDINQIKALTRVSMGSCGGKTCLSLIKRLYQAEGIPLSEVTEPPVRPVFVEVPLAVLANIKLEDEEGER
ncbi:MAG TPA: sulfurtransferase [Anaerolineaceae bacterium]|nr:sulfurtransferase [Anaerolineaceae bacterium]